MSSPRSQDPRHLQTGCRNGCPGGGTARGAPQETGASGGHGHAHAHGLPGRHHHAERKGLLGTLILTLTILLVEAVGGVLSGSLALLSDAGHMLADVSALALSFLALHLATRPANVRKTYGYYRLEILSALANGVGLVVIAVVIAWEAYERLATRPVIDTRTMVLVAGIGLLANLGGLWMLARSRHGSINVRGAFLHVLSDTLSSVAVVVGGVVMALTGFYLLDALLSFLIAAVIVVGAVRLVKEATDILLEAVPAHVEYAEVCGAIEGVDGVRAVHDVHIWTITSGMHALSCHVVVDRGRAHDNDAILAEVKRLLLDRFRIDHTTIQIESEHYEHVGVVC